MSNFAHIPLGLKYPRVVNAIVEIPKDSHNKNEYDEKLDIIKLDRVLYSPFYFPVDYGFIPQTRSMDGDHLDIMILTNSGTFPGCLVEARPIGVLIMEDDKGVDEKILAVPRSNPQYDHIRRFKQISPHFIREVEHFFMEYKRLEYKRVEVRGWQNRLAAYKIIKAARERFDQLG